jgi:hypothetical protein
MLNLNILVPLLAIALRLVHVSASPHCSLQSQPASPSGLSASSGTDPVVAATWYAGWHSSDFPPENISWSKYSTVVYAFAYDDRSWYIYCSDWCHFFSTTTPDPSVIALQPSDEELLPRFVRLAHENVSTMSMRTVDISLKQIHRTFRPRCQLAAGPVLNFFRPQWEHPRIEQHLSELCLTLYRSIISMV